jgi:hypothetical protein
VFQAFSTGMLGTWKMIAVSKVALGFLKVSFLVRLPHCDSFTCIIEGIFKVSAKSSDSISEPVNGNLMQAADQFPKVR